MEDEVMVPCIASTDGLLNLELNSRVKYFCKGSHLSCYLVEICGKRGAKRKSSEKEKSEEKKSKKKKKEKQMDLNTEDHSETNDLSEVI